jgi:hypothetical protein
MIPACFFLAAMVAFAWRHWIIGTVLVLATLLVLV